MGYQKDAIRSVVNLFKGTVQQADSSIYRNVNRTQLISEGDPVRNPSLIGEERLLRNLRDVQLSNMLFLDGQLEGRNFTIEMETGTGKTYVYLRTILELYRTYGFTKFMIVVPTIAIRKGVEKSIAMLREHFMALYDGLDMKNHAFVYSSATPREISSKFVEARDLSIAVMNIQAFNKETNKLRQQDEYGQVLWDDIRYVAPVVIIDEPQKLEGAGKKKSASLEAIEMINPLFILRYSATHKKLYNQVYKLDSFDAYGQNLVKRIEVRTVHGTIPKDYPYIRYAAFTKDLYARVEIFHMEQGGIIRNKSFNVRGGADLYELSGNLEQYRNMVVQEDPHGLRKLRIGTGDQLLELAIGENNAELNEGDMIRIQIRLAIRTHLDKQLKILRQGYTMKVLTLFFIDAVHKFRDHTAPDGRGEYLRIFDEEYAKVTADDGWRGLFAEYPALFKHYKDIGRVREGYFAVDKNRNAVEVENWESVLDEQKLKQKSQEDVDRGIELILEKKDELISFEEPLAFIFSHSALREGWDNPNVFTLCTLKRGGSEIAKKQEIGRGLRLPVDTNGNRCTDADLNELTIIANDYYDHFAAALQQDFNEQTGFDKDEVTAEIIHQALGQGGLPARKLTAELVDTLRNELLAQGLIDGKNRLTKDAGEIRTLDFKDTVLQEHGTMIKEKLIQLMLAKGTKRIPIKNGDDVPVENGPHSYMSEEYFAMLLGELSVRMAKRTMYRVQIDHEAFVAACIVELDGLLRHKRLRSEYGIETGKAAFNEGQKFVLGESFLHFEYEDAGEQTGVRQKSDFEIINYIMYHTLLPRLAIYRIISGLEGRRLLGNQDILDAATQRIKGKLKEFKAAGITEYGLIEGYKFDDRTIFEADAIDRAMLDEASGSIYATASGNRRAMHKYYKLDSKGEREFAERLDSDERVLLYTKIKRGGFVIDTPYGEYSPDWAVIYRGEGRTAKLYFIVETKTDKDYADLSGVERLKIRCGELHFKAVSHDVDFHWADSYNDFKSKIRC
nr:DEAD/DEAH box helicase family protein [Paenibacillus oenotherae]